MPLEEASVLRLAGACRETCHKLIRPHMLLWRISPKVGMLRLTI